MRIGTGLWRLAVALAVIVIGIAGRPGTGSANVASAAPVAAIAVGTTNAPAAEVPGSCAQGDSWCAYCMNHPDAPACSSIAPVLAPQAQSQAPAPAASTQPVTNPGAAIIEPIYLAGVAAAEVHRLTMTGASWTWCRGGAWLRRTGNGSPPC